MVSSLSLCPSSHRAAVLSLYVSSIGRPRLLSPLQDVGQQTRNDDLQWQEINFLPTSRDSQDGGFNSYDERAHHEWGTLILLHAIIANADIQTRSEQLLSSDLSKGSSGYTRSFDCTQTPVLFNPTSKIFITYEDAQSFKAKGAYAKQMGLAGVVGSFLLPSALVLFR